MIAPQSKWLPKLGVRTNFVCPHMGDDPPDQKGRSDWRLTSTAAVGNIITGQAKSGSIPPESAQETSDRICTMRLGSGLRVREPGLVARYGSIYALLVSGARRSEQGPHSLWISLDRQQQGSRRSVWYRSTLLPVA